jgi:hypothetical protein
VFIQQRDGLPPLAAAAGTLLSIHSSTNLYPPIHPPRPLLSIHPPTHPSTIHPSTPPVHTPIHHPSIIHPLPYSFTHSSTHPSIIHPLTHPSKYPPIHPPTHSATYPSFLLPLCNHKVIRLDLLFQTPANEGLAEWFPVPPTPPGTRLCSKQTKGQLVLQVLHTAEFSLTGFTLIAIPLSLFENQSQCPLLILSDLV